MRTITHTDEHYCEGCERGPDEVELRTSKTLDPGASEATEWCVDCIRAMPVETRKRYGFRKPPPPKSAAPAAGRKATSTERRKRRQQADELAQAHAEGAHAETRHPHCLACDSDAIEREGRERLRRNLPGNVVAFPVDRQRPAPTTDELMALLRREIASGRLDDHLHDIWQALRQRHLAARAVRQAQAMATVYEGARVKVAATARSVGLRGATGVVTKVARTRVTVKLDADGGMYRMPATMVEVL